MTPSLTAPILEAVAGIEAVWVLCLASLASRLCETMISQLPPQKMNLA